MTELTKLKQDRDACYVFACAAYGKEFVDEHLYEPNESDEQTINGIMETRKVFKPVNQEMIDDCQI